MQQQIADLEQEKEKMIKGFNELKASFEKLNRIYQSCWEMKHAQEEMLESMKKELQKSEHQKKEALKKLARYKQKAKSNGNL